MDGIVDELAKDPRVAACYDAWQEMRNQVLQTYADKQPGPLPLSQQKEFRQIKNMVIRAGLELDTDAPQVLPETSLRHTRTYDMPESESSWPTNSGLPEASPHRTRPDAPISAATNLLRGLSKLFEDQQQKQSAQTDHIDRKRLRELREKRQLQGHAQDEQIQNY
ncbi:hypothetical protein FACS1894191_6650 [Clostridia bacterium]|nr:hypothetical protein FACS1894191_6650 [Clostridia bacterium]